MTHYTKLGSRELNNVTFVFDYTSEDTHPSELFDDSCTNIKEICRKIDRGIYQWFILRVQVMFKGHILATSYLGGCLYENPNDVFSDGVADDLMLDSYVEAMKYTKKLVKDLNEVVLL